MQNALTFLRCWCAVSDIDNNEKSNWREYLCIKFILPKKLFDIFQIEKQNLIFVLPFYVQKATKILGMTNESSKYNILSQIC